MTLHLPAPQMKVSELRRPLKPGAEPRHSMAPTRARFAMANFALAAVGLSLLLPPSPARAEWTPRIETRAVAATPYPAGDVLVNGVLILRFRTASGGYAPVLRARMAADVLRQGMA